MQIVVSTACCAIVEMRVGCERAVSEDVIRAEARGRGRDADNNIDT